jgi:hypothetical protein
MIELATKYLPVAQQRQRIEENKQKVATDEGRKKFMDGLEKVKADFPDMVKPDTELSKFMNEWDNNNLTTFDAQGKVEKQGKVPVELSRFLISNPYEHAAMIKASFDQIVLARGEAAELKKKIALSESPESGAPPVGSKGKEKTADDLLKEMEAMASSLGQSAY